MNKGSMLNLVTSGLTGHRERDIVYLTERIREYSTDIQLVSVLKNILGCLGECEMSFSG